MEVTLSAGLDSGSFPYSGQFFVLICILPINFTLALDRDTGLVSIPPTFYDVSCSSQSSNFEESDPNYGLSEGSDRQRLAILVFFRSKGYAAFGRTTLSIT
jgi:hypothetical protein